MNNDGSKHWEAFKTKTATLDAIRNENFWTTFTEYKGL
jgi:hypothetical protein